MSFTCGIHGWHNTQKACPTCDGMRNVPMEHRDLSGMQHKDESEWARQNRIYGLINVWPRPNHELTISYKSRSVWQRMKDLFS